MTLEEYIEGLNKIRLARLELEKQICLDDTPYEKKRKMYENAMIALKSIDEMVLHAMLKARSVQGEEWNN